MLFAYLCFTPSFKINCAVRPGEDNRLADRQKRLLPFDLSDGSGRYQSLLLHAM